MNDGADNCACPDNTENDGSDVCTACPGDTKNPDGIGKCECPVDEEHDDSGTCTACLGDTKNPDGIGLCECPDSTPTLSTDGLNTCS